MSVLVVDTEHGVPAAPGGPGVRLRAQVTDLAVIAGWAAVAAAAGLAARALGYDFGEPSRADLFALVTLVAPVTITFAVQEASPRQATVGKRRSGLQVADRDGHRLRFGRALARSAAKFAPWQLAHSAVFGLLAGSTNTWLAGLAVAAQVVVVASFVTMAFDADHRAFHDLVAGTRVIRPSKGDRP